MRRSFFGAQPARSLGRTFGSQQPRRTFATPTTKPIQSSQTQAHPIGPFYEAILNSAQPLPEKKPEVAPVTSKTTPPSPPIAPAPKPAAEGKTPAETKAPAETKTPAETKAPAEAKAPAPTPAAAAPTPARRGRKPKETTKAKPEPVSSSAQA